MKKRLVIIGGSLSLLVLLLGYAFYALSIQRGQDTVTRIYQADQNGTPIISPSPILLVGKANHRNLFQSGINGYVLTNRNPLGTWLPRHNQTIRLKYRSALTKPEIQKTLRQARYLQAGTQNTATPVFENRQYQGNPAQYGRISTSHDGRVWTKLPISYPNVHLKQPSVSYRQGRLTLFDGSLAYWTTNFKDWHRQRLQVTTTRFKHGQVQTVLARRSQSPLVIIRGTDRQTKRVQLYYGQLTSRFKVTRWQQLRLGNLQAKQVVGLNLINRQLVLFRQQQSRLLIYRAKRLTEPVKRVGAVRLEHARHQRVTAVNLVAVSKRHYQLVFSLATRGHLQKQLRYRRLNQYFRATGKQHLLVTDYLWTQFQISQHGSE
ncbi:polysaccharide biosynthesis protein [Lactiplantibacillus pentosus]|uniref:Polysaccharide biosynthesis protein n=2 Tax=Lactiplantibacillus pentosus TaxID=1589 RepID=A0AAX6LHI9_LACPE|nr:polysaccharide biosynthesis protein [Lactiplantibacillus pentosus]MDF2313999.1 polysaccharide biosynthesis protein [Lactiplantibacillus pentosus]USR87040.1 polysaccharide biosynthesis protein [Lactiplantibacillus pentosus]WMB63351.1 polysaccharide biosynthesis protein [Lactiplantibacillus pentosus]